MSIDIGYWALRQVITVVLDTSSIDIGYWALSSCVCIAVTVRNDASGTIIFLSGFLILLFSFSLSFIIMTKTDYKTHTPFHDAH